MIRISIVAALALALAAAACGEPGREEGAPPANETGAASPAADAALARAPAAFVQCKTCHAVAPGKHGVGPSLAGVHGTKAGEIPGYTFSSAMKASGLTWDDPTLDRFIESPMQTVPGTKMVYPGLKDPAKRAEVIAYLKTL